MSGDPQVIFTSSGGEDSGDEEGGEGEEEERRLGGTEHIGYGNVWQWKEGERVKYERKKNWYCLPG